MLGMKTSDQPPLVHWWLKGQDSQNFGDFLTDFLWYNLAGHELRIMADVYRLTSSAIDDGIIRDDLGQIGKWDSGRIAFWCCGMRDYKALSADSLARSVFCGVRGPLTRDRLYMPLSTPIGDPGLLLPLFYAPKLSEKTKGRTVCSPHFLDETSDEDLLVSTGAEVIVRPCIANSHDALAMVLNDLASAEFVLAGSLHAAIVACAYGVPFCYLDRGQVDIPFKWRDFSASIKVGSFFVDNAAEGRRIYDTAIRPRLSKPLLFPILAAAPFRVRPEALLKAAVNDATLLKAGALIDQDAFSAFIELASQDIAAAVGSKADCLAIRDLRAQLDEATIAHQAALQALGKERDAAQAAQAEAEARAADRERERDAATGAFAKAEGRATQAKAQRDMAWTVWQSQLAEVRQERDFLARYLSRIFERPWRPIRQLISYRSLNALSRFSAPLDERSSARFKRSAEKRSPARFVPLQSPDVIARRQNGKFNILYFSPFPSHPAYYGSQANIQQFGRRFQSLGHKVHFALLQSDFYDAEAERAMRETWDTLDIVPNTKQLCANGSEILFDGWYENGLGEEIRFLCGIYNIDVVFCSYVFQSKLLEYVPSNILKVIDTHDKMGDRYDMLRKNGLPLEFFSCSPEEEGEYLRRADVVVARREEEARYFNSVTGRYSAIVIPHVEEPRYLDKQFDKLGNVGMVASANHINLAIALDFLEAVALLCGANCPFTVHIAGQVKDMLWALPPDRAKAFHAPWVRLHGFVADIGSFYRDMDVIVSPVTMGTGINVKTVQAMAYGMPLLTTRFGGKGIETDEPMHNHSEVESLVRRLLSLVEEPEELNRLAAVSRMRYGKFYENAAVTIRTVFEHEKLMRPR